MTRWQPPVCPQDRDHGTLLDWPTAYAAWYCPNVRHSGSHFYRTDLDPAPPTADVPTADSTAAVGNRRPSGSPARGGSGTPVADAARHSPAAGAIQSN